MALITQSPWIEFVRGDIEAFNRRAAGERPDLEDADLRLTDLRNANLGCANLRGAYMRDCDMRGLDLSGAEMAGASLHNARISGVLFPKNILASEISLSVTFGTRMRTQDE